MIKMISKNKTSTVKYFKTLDSLVKYMRINKGWMDTLLQDYVLFECRSIRHDVNKLLEGTD